MADAMVPLATLTLTSTSSSVTFSSIPGTYRDLRIVMNVSRAAGSSDVGFEINGTNAVDSVYMAGFGTSVGSGTGAGLLTYVSNTPMLNVVDIMDYSAVDKHKCGLTRYGGGGIFTASQVFKNLSTAPVMSLRFYLGSGTFDIGSTFSLYGIIA